MSNAIQRRRIKMLLSAGLLIATALGLILYALKQNINLYYTPTQIYHGEAPKHQRIRVGGLVKKHSVQREGLDVSFIVSDLTHELNVHYHGILPDLFREGQGIVANGKIDSKSQFQADEVLAKHDENYMPPEVAASLKSTPNVD